MRYPQYILGLPNLEMSASGKYVGPRKVDFSVNPFKFLSLFGFLPSVNSYRHTNDVPHRYEQIEYAQEEEFGQEV